MQHLIVKNVWYIKYRRKRYRNIEYNMYGHTHSKIVWDQPGKVANSARGQLNRENEYSPIPEQPFASVLVYYVHGD